MDNSLLAIKSNYYNKNIFLLESWLEDRFNLHSQNVSNPSMIEKMIKLDVATENIQNIVDKSKVPSVEDKVAFNVKQAFLKGPIFLQIDAIANIGDATHKQEGKLDEIEKIDNKYLRTESEQEINKKSEKEKVVLKFLLNNGKETFYGFEYDKLQFVGAELPKYQKIVVNNDIEVRRGILYLKNSNVSLF